MTINNLNQLTKNEGLTIRKLNNLYYLIIDQDAYEANEIGTTIINALGRDMPLEDLYLRLSQKYEFGDINQIAADVGNFIDFLVSEKLAYYA